MSLTFSIVAFSTNCNDIVIIEFSFHTEKPQASSEEFWIRLAHSFTADAAICASRNVVGNKVICQMPTTNFATTFCLVINIYS